MKGGFGMKGGFADRAERLLEQVLRQPPEQRHAFLDAGCAGEPELHRELEALLPYAESEADFLRSPVVRLTVSELDELFTTDDAAAEDRPPAQADLPRQIGDYHILGLLGAGGVGMTYEARHKDTGRGVALKVLHPGPATPAILRRFATEARLLGRFDHPGIARLVETGNQEVTDSLGRVYPLPFLVLELIRGERLDEWLAAAERSLGERLEVFARICDAVHYVHRQGVLHRDLKPANVLVEESGRPRLLDFGIARLLEVSADDPSRSTLPGQILGSLAYMSPEQLRGDHHRLDERSDVYALGVLLYRMLTGRLPFEVQNLSAAEAAFLNERTAAVSPDSLDRTLSGILTAITMRALHKDRERRYPCAGELATDIYHYLNDCGGRR